MGVSKNYGYHFGGPNNKDCNILGSILGVPMFWGITATIARIALLTCCGNTLQGGREALLFVGGDGSGRPFNCNPGTAYF